MGNISVESKSVVELLELFKEDMNKLDNLNSKIKTTTANIKNSWQGNASSATFEQVKKFDNLFAEINEQNKKYVDFANLVIEKYTDIDNSDIDFVDSHINSYDVSYVGKERLNNKENN